MTDRIDERLLRILSEIDFAPRYYAIAQGPYPDLELSEFKARVSAVWGDARFNKKERFYRRSVPLAGARLVRVHAAYLRGTLELASLGVWDGRRFLGGGTFHGLAYDLSERPPKPPYPKVPSTRLEEGLRFADAILEEVASALRT